MKDLTPRTKSGLGHALIKEKQENKSIESPIQFTAATGGKSLPVYTGAGAKRKLDYKQQPISNEVFKDIQKEEGLSNRSVERIQSNIRRNLGHSSVETGLHQELMDDPKVLEKYFKAEMIPFDMRDHSNITNQQFCLCKKHKSFNQALFVNKT